MSEFSAVAPPKSLSGSYDTSSAFADAVQRARQIAAKIHSGGNDTSAKRPLEDGQADGIPETKKLATQDSIALQIATMQAQRAASAVANAISVEEWKVPDKMVGLIIGRGGEQITRLQAESGCKVQMAADSGGMPERICTLTGTRSAIDCNSKFHLQQQKCKAKDLMTQIINRGGPPLPMLDTNHVPDGHTIVEMAIPGPKVGLVIGKGGETIRNLQERAGVKMVLIQDGPQQTASEKPLRITGEPDKCEFAKQLVMDLITEKELESLQKSGIDGTNDYGSTAGGGPTPGSGGSHEIMVPKQAVGVVIGKGGDMIKKIQQDSGAKVQFLNVKDEGPEDKVCIVSGSPEQIQSATNFINDLIQSVLVRDQQNMGRGRGRGRTDGPGLGAGRGRSDVPEVHYSVPANKCGIVIGKGGETVKSIISQCGAYVTLSALPPPNPNEKIFIIKGQLQQIEHAKELINEKMGCGGTVVQTQNAPSQAQQPYPPQFTQPQQQPQPQQPQQFQPPAAPPQQFAAPQGWTNPYQPWQTPGAPATDPNAAAWAAYYSQYYGQQAVQPPQPGQPAPAAAAVQPGVAPQHGIPSQPEQTPGQPQPPTATAAPAVAPAAAVPAATAAGQPDYSAAWAEYYRSLGMFREAEMIENQARAQAQLTGTMGVPQPGQPFPQPAAAATAPVSVAAPVPAPQPTQPGAPPPGPVPPTSVTAPVPSAASQPAPAPAVPVPAPVPTGVPAPGQPQPFPGAAPQGPGQWPAAPAPYPQQFGQQQPNAFVGYNFPNYGQPPFSAAQTAAPAPQ